MNDRLEGIRKAVAAKDVYIVGADDSVLDGLLTVAEAAERLEYSLGFPFGSNLHFSNPQLSALTTLRAALAGLGEK